ncbi:hypothetical protein ACMBCN_01470, partial [Candidatus Liberibacter asiaticus]|nr:hypothetical protein [Candidatus Liberibacter asiaticus]
KTHKTRYIEFKNNIIYIYIYIYIKEHLEESFLKYSPKRPSCRILASVVAFLLLQQFIKIKIKIKIKKSNSSFFLFC